MERRNFIKNSALLTSMALLPTSFWPLSKNRHLRTAHVGVGGMGLSDLNAISSHDLVEVVALCDVDENNLDAAKRSFPNARCFTDYRKMLKELEKDIDAVIVSTPDHTHAPASLMAMNMGKSIYCQKPLAHNVFETRAMSQLASDNNIITQMGIQVHSFYDYKLATSLIQSGIIGKIKSVRAWSSRNWGYNGPVPVSKDPIPDSLKWDLWLGTSVKRPYKKNFYHPANWRRLLDYGCGNFGDMGAHIFDTPYNALELDAPKTIKAECRKPNGFGYPEKNVITYKFQGTRYTKKNLKLVWYDGPGSPKFHKDLNLPNNERLPDQGAMFVGERGRLLLPHFMKPPKLIVDNTYQNMDAEVSEIEVTKKLGVPIRNYATEGPKHYHQFVDACLGKDSCSAPFSYSSKLTEVILLGLIAGRFPYKTLHWDSESAKFSETNANQFLHSTYRKF